MNTTRTSMRTVLAAAAAGALIMGSAAGAMAAPKAKEPKAGSVTVTKVDIRKHKAINLDAPYGDLMVRVKVRDTSAAADARVTSVTLALFDTKRSLTAIAETPTVMATAVLPDKTSGKDKKWITYSFKVTPDLFAPVESAVRAGTDGFKGLLCISALGVTGDVGYNKQSTQRLNTDKNKKTVRECVRVYDATDAVPSS